MSSDNNKVAFSLTKSKKKRKAPPSVVGVANEFDATETDKKKKRSSSPNWTLVIPLPKSSSSHEKGPLLARNKTNAPKSVDNATQNEIKDDKNEDDKAAQALIDEAAQHFAQKDAAQESTDFSASGKLVISSENNTNISSQQQETDQFRQDVDSRPEEVPVDSDVYDNVRVVDFGAAMLRGMGWKGNGNDKKKEDDDMALPRPHRLGLGATPKMPSANNNKMRRPDQLKRDELQKQQYEEYEAKRKEQLKLDKQVTMQTGSIVSIDGRRAKMVQLQGVPGLNQVRIQYEQETEPVSVKRSLVSLISRDDLNKDPFREPKQDRRKDVEKRNGNDSQPRDKEESRRKHSDRERRERRRDDSDRRHGRSSDKERKDDCRSRKRSRSREREDRKRKRGDRVDEDAKRSWLIPNIRVRIVTNKFGSRQYKQKGVVLDVTPGGGAATLEMENGQVLERVSERHLETALPKAGGNAIVLVGKHRMAKGKLLERDSHRGIIQVFEDMSVLTLSLDDVAQWCGPLDDDLEL